MSNDHAAPSGNPFTFANARKAWTAGVAGAVTGAGTISLTGIFADGKVDSGEGLAVAAAVVGGFAIAFVSTYFQKKNADDETNAAKAAELDATTGSTAGSNFDV